MVWLARVVSLSLVMVPMVVAGCTDPDHPVFNEYEGGYQLDADGDPIMWMGDDCHWVTALRLELVNDAGNVYETWGVRSESAGGGDVSTHDDYRTGLMGRDNADIYPLCAVHG
ncbi:MAG TPA: hypothetical protein VEX15_02495 [Nocardioidaceae bacterium]|nr:hypothetical protein [Nocardioidaceae bacterium]